MRSPSPLVARLILAAGLGLLAAAWDGHTAQADVSPVVAHVGTQTITAADLERRLAQVPPFQLRSFGKDAAEIRRNFLEKVLVREALLAQGGAERGLAERPEVKDKIRNILRNTMLAKIRGEVQKASGVTDADIKAYYEQNASKYHSPPRVALWEIVTAKREQADAILADLKKETTPKKWTEIAREQSIDKATAMRGGNLGFVSPDGSTAEPGLKVSRAVLDAVDKVKDGELVGEPIKDGDRWVIVWKRQTMKSVDRPVEMELGSIKQILLHGRTEAKIKELIAGLRKEHLSEHNPETLDMIEITPQGDLAPVHRPGTLPMAKRANPVPAAPGMR